MSANTSNGRPPEQVLSEPLEGPLLRRRRVAAALLAALSAPIALAVAPARGAARPRSLTETNRAIVTDFARLFYTEGKIVEAFEKYVMPSYIQHNPDFPDGRDAVLAVLPKLVRPDSKFEVKRIIVDGDMAAVHIHGRPDPKSKGVAVVDLYRLQGGKIAEHWDVVQPVPDNPRNPHAMF